MISLAVALLITWPDHLQREQVLPETEVLGLAVSSWHVLSAQNAMQEWVNSLDCVELPEVQLGLWQCLAADRIYSWDQSTQPSLWSESKRVISPNATVELGTVSVAGMAVKHWQEQRPLYQLFLSYQRQIEQASGVVMLEQRMARAFVLHWQVAEKQHVVVGWQERPGSVLMTQLDL